MLWANRWRSLPQIPPVATATLAHDGPGSTGSGSSARDAGNSGSTMSNWTARTAASVGAVWSHTRWGGAVGDGPRRTIRQARCEGQDGAADEGGSSWAWVDPRASVRSRLMRVPDSTLDEVRQRGFSLVEGFLDPSELAAAQEALWLHFPRPHDYFADQGPFSRFEASQFAGVEEFPYRSWDLNGLAVHPDLVDMAERYLQTTELHLYKVELWAKYSGAVDYDQPLHRDYGSHSLVVPRPEAAVPASDDLRLPLRRDRPRMRRPASFPTTRAVRSPTHRCTCRSARWPRLRFVAPARRGRCSSTAPTSSIAARTSSRRDGRVSRSSRTSRSAEPPGAARWPGPSSHLTAGRGSSLNAVCASVTCSDSHVPATPTGTARRSTGWRRAIPGSTWSPTGRRPVVSDPVWGVRRETRVAFAASS